MEYGPVIICGGKNKGKFGFYDDEDDDGNPIVYLWGGRQVTVERDDMAAVKVLSEDPDWFTEGTIGKSIL